MAVVAGVDSSTQSTTVVLKDADSGTTLGVGSAPHPPTFPPVSEQNPADWWTALGTAMGRARDEARIRPQDIEAISVAAQCHGLVPLDSAGRVIRPAKLWNDTTSAAQAMRLREVLPVPEWVERVGSLPPPAFTISKLVWLAEQEPENFKRLARVLLPHDWITWGLSGNAVTDRSDASGTGYFSASRNRYDDGILDLVDADRDWSSVLPRVLGPTETAGGVSNAIADELGVAGGATVCAGSGDQHAGAVGLGVERGDIVFVFGTSGVVYGLSPTEIHDPTGAVNSVAAATEGYQPLVCTLNAAKVTDTFARLLGVDHHELSRLALAADGSADRPVLAAFLDGERTPDRPAARGTLAGLTTSTRREDLALAGFEGAVLGLVEGYDQLSRLGVENQGRVFITGGGAASPAYQQVLADALGRDVLLAESAQPVASGAAIQAAAVLRGVILEDVRAAWAPATKLAAHPRGMRAIPPVRERYAVLSGWRGLES
ncbi:MAG: xylulokinase [Gemmatimonadaceae bacterium]